MSTLLMIAKFTAALFLTVALAGPVFGFESIEREVSSGVDDIELNFNFGDSCGRLEELSESSLMKLLDSRNLRQWQRFCRIAEPLDCGEFDYLLEGFGFLTPNKTDGFMCRFEPSRELHQEWLPDFYQNYGSLKNPSKTCEEV